MNYKSYCEPKYCEPIYCEPKYKEIVWVIIKLGVGMLVNIFLAAIQHFEVSFCVTNMKYIYY